jgi:uncharacterized membrane protein YbhN (UPF0104 family)
MPRWLGLALRLLGTAGGLAWIALTVDLSKAFHSIGRIPVGIFVLACALVAANVVAGALRWKVLLRAYGATRIPPVGRLVYLYFVAFFYNNYLPGAITGDVGRGVVTHEAFEQEGATAAIAVVLVERVQGLFALFALLAVGLVVAGGTIDSSALWWWTVLGCAGSVALVACVPIARRLAPYLPRPLAKIAGRLPALHDTGAFVMALGWSLVTQALIALAGWQLLAAMGPIDLGASLLVVPLAAATAFVPITVGGAGAREQVYITLCGSLFGMPAADALAASIGLWGAHLAVGAVGGVLQLLRPAKQRTGDA